MMCSGKAGGGASLQGSGAAQACGAAVGAALLTPKAGRAAQAAALPATGPH